MLKLTLATTAALLVLGISAVAETRPWNVTEENDSGIKNAQGVWTVTIDAENKITGSADMQLFNGTPLTYKLDGSVKEGVYTVNLVDRSDGKKGCVWTGHQPTGGGQQTSGLIGYAPCEGAKLIVRASH